MLVLGPEGEGIVSNLRTLPTQFHSLLLEGVITDETMYSPLVQIGIGVSRVSPLSWCQRTLGILQGEVCLIVQLLRTPFRVFIGSAIFTLCTLAGRDGFSSG